MNAKTLQTDLTKNPVKAYLNSLTSPVSKRTQLSSLKSVIAMAMKVEPGEVDPIQVYEFTWHLIDPAMLKSLRAALIKKYSPAMASKSFAAVRGVLGACFDQRLIDAETFLRLQRVKGIKVDRNQKTGRCLSEGEIAALAKVCAEDQSAAGARDDAIIALGYTQGPRVSEFAKFELSDYDRKTGELQIRNGKGNKSRTIRAANSTKISMDEWLKFRGDEPGPLFCAINKAGDIKISGLSQQSLSKLMHRRADEAGIPRFAIHDLRRTFITKGWAIGIPGVRLQMLAGHSSQATTASYDRGSLEDALKEVDKLHYPSQRNDH